MAKLDTYDALLKISETINSMEAEDVLLEKVMDIAMESLHAERGFILHRKAGSDKFEAVSARNISQENIGNIQNLSSSVVNQVFKTGEAVLTFDALSDGRFSEASSVILQGIRSIACTPMLVKNEIIGAIYIDSCTETDQFTEESLLFLKAFAGQAVIALENFRKVQSLSQENKLLKKQISLGNIFPEIIGKSSEIQTVLEMITKIANTTAATLIEGESGTGKELVAKALHYHSSRKAEPLMPVFCGGLTESLLESELFGHKKGSFTGAVADKIGLFEAADGGTVFLDEIGDINMNIQTKLLRVIQEGEIKRIGETKVRHVNVRIVSATNKDLWQMVQNKEFREDLYYRLNVINIKMPPLRERGNDIIVLAEHFLQKFAKANNKQIKGFSTAAEKGMKEYQWSGNIRELINAVERAVILSHENRISPALLNLNKTRVNNLIGKSLKAVEKAVIIETLELTNNHRSKAAEILGVSRRWLQYKIKEWDLDKI